MKIIIEGKPKELKEFLNEKRALLDAEVSEKKLSLMFESKDKNGKSIFNKEIGDTISILVKTKDNRVQSAAVVVDTVNQDGCHEFKRIELEIIQSVIKEV